MSLKVRYALPQRSFKPVLGQFEGRLKGYDSEEDLLGLVTKGNTPK